MSQSNSLSRVEIETWVLKDLTLNASKTNMYKNLTQNLEAEIIGHKNHVFLLEKKINRYAYRDSLHSVQDSLQREMLINTTEKFKALADYSKDLERSLKVEKRKNWIVGIGGTALGVLIYKAVESIF